MEYDLIPGAFESCHRDRETIAGDSLYDILGELPAVSFERGELLCLLVHALISYAVISPFVGSERRAGIEQLALRGELNGKEILIGTAVILPPESDHVPNVLRLTCSYALDSRILGRVPEIDDALIGITPPLNDLLAESQFRDLAFTAESVLGISLLDLLDRHSEHL